MKLKIKCWKSWNILQLLLHQSWGLGHRYLRIYHYIIRSRLDYGRIVYGSVRASTLCTLHSRGTVPHSPSGCPLHYGSILGTTTSEFVCWRQCVVPWEMKVCFHSGMLSKCVFKPILSRLWVGYSCTIWALLQSNCLSHLLQWGWAAAALLEFDADVQQLSLPVTLWSLFDKISHKYSPKGSDPSGMLWDWKHLCICCILHWLRKIKCFRQMFPCRAPSYVSCESRLWTNCVHSWTS